MSQMMDEIQEEDNSQDIQQKFKVLVETLKVHMDDPVVKTQVLEESVALLKNLVNCIYNRHFKSFSAHRDDLVQEGYQTIIEHMLSLSYDPDESMPSTFFYVRIFHAMNTYLHRDKQISEYYRKNARMIAEAKDRLMLKGKKVSAAALSIETGLTEHTIRSTQLVMHMRDIKSLEEHSKENQLSSQEKNPEEMMIYNLEMEALSDGLSKLPAKEREVLKRYFEDEQSLTMISKELHTSMAIVRRRYNMALEHLRKNHKIDNIYSDRKLTRKDKGLQKDIVLMPSEEVTKRNDLLSGGLLQDDDDEIEFN